MSKSGLDPDRISYPVTRSFCHSARPELDLRFYTFAGIILFSDPPPVQGICWIFSSDWILEETGGSISALEGFFVTGRIRRVEPSI